MKKYYDELDKEEAEKDAKAKIEPTSMVQDDMEAFIYPAQFNSDY